MIYIDTDNGTWGDSELLILVDDKEWTNEDFEEMHNWNDSMINSYGRMWLYHYDNPKSGNSDSISTLWQKLAQEENPKHLMKKVFWKPPTPKQWAEQDYFDPFEEKKPDCWGDG